MYVTPIALPENFEIVTERLRLRLHDVSLAGPVSTYYARNRAHFAATSPLRAPSFHSVETWRSRAAELRQASLNGHVLHLLLFRRDQATDEVVGDVIMANYVPTNERSGRVLRRLGFQVEGFARDYLFLEGQWKDHLLTSLTNPSFTTD